MFDFFYYLNISQNTKLLNMNMLQQKFLDGYKLFWLFDAYKTTKIFELFEASNNEQQIY